MGDTGGSRARSRLDPGRAACVLLARISNKMMLKVLPFCLLLSGAGAFLCPAITPRHSLAVFGTAGSKAAVGSGEAGALAEAVSARSVEAGQVLSLLTQLEEQAKKQPVRSLPGAEQVRGKRWEIVYSSLLKSGYMPSLVKEVVQVDYEAGLIRIDTVAGPLPLGSVLGSCEWANNVLTFTFDQYELGPLRVPVPPKPKTYEFVYVDDKVAAARSSSGALTLMGRV